MIVKPCLDQSDNQAYGVAPGFARAFEKFGFMFEPVDTPRGGAAEGQP